jgi:hypothetical protein
MDPVAHCRVQRVRDRLPIAADCCSLRQNEANRRERRILREDAQAGADLAHAPLQAPSAGNQANDESSAIVRPCPVLSGFARVDAGIIVGGYACPGPLAGRLRNEATAGRSRKRRVF